MSKTKLKFLIILNFFWFVLGIIADYNWLSQIPWYLVPLTAICSLYPLLLFIWYLLKFYQRKIPHFFSFWIVLGISSYGILAQFYFPLLMSWAGINFHDIGSMFWVAVYGVQSLILIKYLKIASFKTMLPGLIFILSADYVHYFFPTFLDFTLTGYPEWMKNLTALITLLIQFSLAFSIYIGIKRK